MSGRVTKRLSASYPAWETYTLLCPVSAHTSYLTSVSWGHTSARWWRHCALHSVFSNFHPRSHRRRPKHQLSFFMRGKYAFGVIWIFPFWICTRSSSSAGERNLGSIRAVYRKTFAVYIQEEDPHSPLDISCVSLPMYDEAALINTRQYASRVKYTNFFFFVFSIKIELDFLSNGSNASSG